MKATTRRRLLSLLLALALALSLAPAALAEDEAPSGDETDPPPSAPLSTIVLTANGALFSGSSLSNLDPGGSVPMTATLSSGDIDGVKFSWIVESASEDIISINYETASADRTRTAAISAHVPGEALFTVSAERDGVKVAEPVTVSVTVNGVRALKPEISILENENYTLQEGVDYQRFGTAGASSAAPALASLNQTFVRATGSSWTNLALDGIEAGAAQVTLAATESGKAAGGTATFSVTVESNQAVTLRGNASSSEPMRFSTLESQIASQCRSLTSGSLVSVTGLSVSTEEGILYLNYKSADDTGSGVGSALTYYVSSSQKGPYIKDIAFVPSLTFTGDTAEIDYTGTADNGRTFKGKIQVTVASATTDITLNASPENPARFTGSAFSAVCQRQTGAPLSYVVFTLPPANEGIIYEGYVNDTNYSARVTATDQYNQTALNSLTFVPTPGYVGTVSISYAGYSATGVRYNGEVHIRVSQSLDECIIYNDGGSGVVPFSEADFAGYCLNVTGGRLGYVSFTPPAASQGTLYRSWNGSRGAIVTDDHQFYAGQRVSTIDPITFVAAGGFSGTVRIPFSGEDRSGVPFTGIVEINVQSGNAGEIAYACAPGGSVKLSASDFNDMSLRLTGQRLHYIIFHSLPDYVNGAFYHNRTSAGGMGDSVSRDVRYYNSSAPYIMNLSFWASDSFRGVIEVPFTGCAVSGETFSSVLVITASASVGGTNTVSYATDGRVPVAFSAADFDAVSRSATNSALNYVRFTLPSSGEGILYFDYNPSAAPVAVSSTDSLYQGGNASVSRVSFLPAYGYSGTVYIPFSGWAISGAQFQGTVVITVRGGATDTTVRYGSRGEPVTFSNYAFQGTGGNQLVSIRLEALPAEQEGRLYYRYTCPGKYSWAAAAGTDYLLSGDPQISSLTFVPRAGFSGRVAIPYTAVNADGTTFTGEISITVEPVTSSAYFNDLSGANSETLAAVDFLCCRGVVGGVGAGKFAPNQTIRRGDFCLMLYRAFQFTSDGTVGGFIDVPYDSYYAQAIQVLRSLGIVNGTGNNRFEPQADISRQDAALMIQRVLRAAGIAAPDGAASLLEYYSDGAETASYAQGAMACLIQLKLLPSAWGQLSSKAALTRADMAVMLHRAMTR